MNFLSFIEHPNSDYVKNWIQHGQTSEKRGEDNRGIERVVKPSLNRGTLQHYTCL